MTNQTENSILRLYYIPVVPRLLILEAGHVWMLARTLPCTCTNDGREKKYRIRRDRRSARVKSS